MAPQTRKKENEKLPARWRKKGKRYYYRVPKGLEHLWDGKTEFSLGSTLSEAHRNFSARIDTQHAALNSIKQLCDKYSAEIVPTKAPATQRSNLRSLERIRYAIGENRIRAVKPSGLYQYRNHVADEFGKKTANLDLEVLSHMFTQAIEWGAVDRHPMTSKQVKKFSLQSRDRYVEDWELKEALKVATPLIKAYLNLKGLLGLRLGDMLSIRLADIKDDGLHVTPRKTAKSTGRRKVYPLTAELEQAIADVKALRKGAKVQSSAYLFATRTGQPYIKDDGSHSGWDSGWQRFMRKVLKDTKVTERFTEHDLRAKVSSDQDSDEEAQHLLDHASVNTTRKTYRRRAVIVKPGKGFKK